MHIDGANTASAAQIARIKDGEESAHEIAGLHTEPKAVPENRGAGRRGKRTLMVQFSPPQGAQRAPPGAG